MNDGSPSHPTDLALAQEKTWLAIVLAWVAGFVDALGFLSLLNIFTSHMSGNSVAMVAHIADGNWSKVFHRAMPLPFFVLGIFAGAILEIGARRLNIRRRFSIALFLEAALLIGFMAYAPNSHFTRGGMTSPLKYFLLIAILSAAMGLQSATLRRVRGQSVHTTFVTGMLLQFAENAAAFFFCLGDRLRGRAGNDSAAGRNYLLRTCFFASIWLVFVLGAICGGFAQRQWRSFALIIPVCILAVIIVGDLIRPIHG